MFLDGKCIHYNVIMAGGKDNSNKLLSKLGCEERIALLQHALRMLLRFVCLFVFLIFGVCKFFYHNFILMYNNLF